MRYFSRLVFQSPHIDSGIWTVPNVWGISYRLLYCRRAQNHFLPNFTSKKKIKLKKSQSPPELCVLISSVRFTSIQNIFYMYVEWLRIQQLMSETSFAEATTKICRVSVFLFSVWYFWNFGMLAPHWGGGDKRPQRHWRWRVTSCWLWNVIRVSRHATQNLKLNKCGTVLSFDKHSNDGEYSYCNKIICTSFKKLVLYIV